MKVKLITRSGSVLTEMNLLQRLQILDDFLTHHFIAKEQAKFLEWAKENLTPFCWGLKFKKKKSQGVRPFLFS